MIFSVCPLLLAVTTQLSVGVARRGCAWWHAPTRTSRSGNSWASRLRRSTSGEWVCVCQSVCLSVSCDSFIFPVVAAVPPDRVPSPLPTPPVGGRVPVCGETTPLTPAHLQSSKTKTVTQAGSAQGAVREASDTSTAPSPQHDSLADR